MTKGKCNMKKELFTIGHSTRTIEEFLALLKKYDITHLVDVRTIPKSRRVPWFNSEELAKSLHKERIDYTHLKSLGGLRHAKKDSINTGWRNANFRGYADYMQTHEFAEGMQQLNELLVPSAKIVVMCAEAVPWRCHRSMIADAELARSINVFHIMSLTKLDLHRMTEFAVIDKSVNPPLVTYPAQDKQLEIDM